MLKKIFGFLKKKDYEEERMPSEIELSKIDKHMNFILRDKLGILNRVINEKLVVIGEEKEEITGQLRALHKKPLMNPNISQREIQIMEGNRENYIKRTSHFIVSLDLPKNYLEAYDYCIKFSKDMELLYRDIQKNIYVLQNFFDNEIKNINKELNKTEQLIIDIRVTFEKNNITMLKKMQDDIKQMTKNLVRINALKAEIAGFNAEIKTYQDRLDKLNERIITITSGADYRMLENFKEEKDKVEEDIKRSLIQFDGYFSELETALRKYQYRNQDKKIVKNYIENSHEAFLNDTNLELINILAEIKESADALGLKDKKKEQTINAINYMTADFLKNIQSELRKLEEHKHRTQTKITHNSAALNLSEQQYWLNTTRDKIRFFESEIEKKEKNIREILEDNQSVQGAIKTLLESITGESVIIKDDLSEQVNEPLVEQK